MKIIYVLSVLSLVVGWALSAQAQPKARVAAQAVQFGVKPHALVLDPTAGRTATALVGVRVKNPGKSKVELVALKTNFGQLGKPQRKGKATWVARFTPPNLRFPTVALIRADVKIDGRLVRRWKAVPVSIRLKLPVATKGAVDVSISVVSREFGPVTPKKRQREISIPVIIPPGAGNYTITRITEQGVTSAETKRFSLPAFPRMVVVGPKSPAAGTTIRVDVFHVGAKGERYTYNVPLIVDCTVGEIVKLRGQRSVQSIWIKLSGRTGPSRIRVSLKQETKIAAVHAFHVELAKTLKLAVSVSPDTLAMTSLRSVKVLVRVIDLFGNAARTPTLKVTANGKPLSVARLEPGLWRGWLYAPSERQPRDRILLRAMAPRASAGTAVVGLIGDLAQRLFIRLAPRAIMADGKRGVDVEILAVDRLGMAPKDRTIKVESAQGWMVYLHRVRSGLFRGRFIPRRNTRGGVAVVTASTHRAHAVSARVRLLPIPQNMLLSTVLGVFSDVGRAVGIQAGLRYEYSVYQGPPAVHIGFQALLAPHFGVGNRAEPDEFGGFSAGVTALARLRLVSRARFGLDAVMDVGVIGIYASYKRYNPPAVDDRQSGRAAFTTSIAIEAGLRTLRQNEVFVKLCLRYLTARFHDASTGNHITLFGGIGYRFEL
jgi:hypothetical protein